MIKLYCFSDNEERYTFRPMEKKVQSQHTVYHFDNYTLNTATYELLHDGRVVELEPKLFQILSALVQKHPRVVTKEALLHDIWHDRVVTDNAISRAIYQLRKIIDSPTSPTLIKTIRGIGYQLDCEVEPLTAEPVNQIQSQNKISPRWFWVGFLLIFMAGLAFFVLKTKTDSEISSIPANQPQETLIAILPLQSNDIKRDYINLSNTLIDYLTIELQSGLGIRVIHPDRLMTLDKERNTLIQVQNATHATHILETFVSEPSSGVMRLHLTLYQKTKAVNLEPYSLGYFDFPWPDNDINLQAIYKARKLTVSEIAQLIKPESRFEINQNMQTSDPMTFRLVIASHHAVVNDQCQGVSHAIDLLQQAVARDPQYVYAWHQLMSLYFKSIWLCGSSHDNYEKALAAADQVERLAKGLFPSVAIARNAVLIETNRVEEAYATNLQYQKEQTNFIYLKVTNLRYAGFLKNAKQHIDSILTKNPYYYSAKPINAAPNTLLYMADYEAHLALLTVPGHIYHDYYRALNFYVRGETKTALDILSTHKTNNPTSTFQYYVMALYHICQQQYKQALKSINALTAWRQKQGHHDGEMTYKQAQLYALAGDKVAALEQLEQSLGQGFFPAQYWQNDPALNTIHDQPRFKELFNRAQQRHRAFARRFNLTAEF